MAKYGTEDPKDAGPKPEFPLQSQDQPGLESAMWPEPDFGETSYKGHARLRDRVALITGGDSGIGRAVALAFAREGADVAISHLPVERSDAERAREAVEKAGRKCLLLPAELSEVAQCEKLVADTVAKLGKLDVLVNNAAYQGKSVERFEELDAERLEKTFRVNILAMFHLVRAALPHLKPGASIINVSSIQSYQPSHNILDYATTKGAITTFTKGLAQELIQRGIRVNAVAPGPVWTPLVVASFPPEKNAKFGKDSPMTRPAQPAELAPAFVFLASDEASYVNGEVLGVTGGKPLA